jgi:nitroreductase
MSHPKHASTDYQIETCLSQRWSPYCFADKDVSSEDLIAIFEAARWAPSAYNEQPWRYIMARRSDEAAFAKLLSCLVEPNQAWARYAPVLIIGVTMHNFTQNASPNKAAQHDLGLAAGNICAEATARGLCVHQMIGIVPERVCELYNVPDDAEPLTALTIGYPGEGSELPKEVQERDNTPRSRRPLTATVFAGSWGEQAKLEK